MCLSSNVFTHIYYWLPECIVLKQNGVYPSKKEALGVENVEHNS